MGGVHHKAKVATSDTLSYYVEKEVGKCNSRCAYGANLDNGCTFYCYSKLHSTLLNAARWSHISKEVKKRELDRMTH